MAAGRSSRSTTRNRRDLRRFLIDFLLVERRLIRSEGVFYSIG
jgi:CII-binding regulator of phage lambda lysogenization HflD